MPFPPKVSTKKPADNQEAADPKEKKKPGLAILIGVGKPGGGGPPPKFSSKKPADGTTSGAQPPEGDEPEEGASPPGAPSRRQQPASVGDTGQPNGQPNGASYTDPDAGGPEQSVAVSPAAVLYHKGSVNCSNCEYMQGGGDCAVLKMPVEPNDWCNAHEYKVGDEDQGQGMNPGMPSQSMQDTGGAGAGGY